MNPYYMTAATRQSLIAESNRLIAARATAGAARRRPASDGANESRDSEWSLPQGDAETSSADVDSAFARLVADLQGVPARSRSSCGAAADGRNPA